MALLNLQNNYIKIAQIDASTIECKFYTSQESRELEKSATASDDIIKKYHELITKAQKVASAELKKQGLMNALTKGSQHIDGAERERVLKIIKNVSELQLEYYNYINDLQDKEGSKHTYPLISKYFPDVENSIPSLTASIIVNVDNALDLDSIYTKLKEEKRFGETIDC